MADVSNLGKGLFVLATFCCVAGGDCITFGDILTEDDLHHYVRGNHEVEEFDIIYPLEDGKRSKRSLSEGILSTTSLKLSVFEEDLHLELYENPWLVPPDLKIKHVFESFVQEEIFHGKRCHFHGRSMNHNDSIAVISTCAGIHGMISFDDNEVFIEPLKIVHKSKLARNVTYDMKQPHIIYKRRLKEGNIRSCGQGHGKERKRKDIGGINFEFYVGPKFMEIKLVLDKTFVTENFPNPTEYALALMNIASRRFVDPSLGFPIHLYLVSIVQFHNTEPFLVSSGLLDTFYSFQSWLNQNRIDDDKDQSHWDHAILLSSYHFDIEVDSAIGYGTILPPMCFPHPTRTSSNAVIDLGLGSGFTIAHEIGHSLGLKHDDADGVGCGTHYIMAHQQNEEQSAFTWSSCSKKSLNKLWRGKPWCLDNIPDDKVRELSISEVNPAPSITQQCTEKVQKLVAGYYESVSGCVAETTCTSLFCELPDSKNVYGNVCTPMGQPPAEGTSCGYYRYCINGKCVSNVKDVLSLDMADGEFSKWETSPCSQSCGGGVKVTRRTCSTPPQEFAGTFCDGQHLHYELCNMQSCPDGKTFLEKRDDSCSSISPDLGFYVFSEDGAPPTCLKACVNHTSYEWDYFEPLYFEDGTKCWENLFNDDFTLEKRCVAGKCVQFNCFGDEGFKGLYDECRVCGGKGTSCFPRNEIIFNNVKQQTIILPAGATSLVVVNYDCQTEQGRTALDLQTGDNVLAYRGNVFEVGFEFPNGIRCAVNLTTTGPLKEELSLSSQYRREIRTNHMLFSVSYFEPKSSPIFLWRLGPFGLCSADCGAGIRAREIRCLEIRNGQEREVADNMCDVLDMPKTTVPCCIPCWSFTFTQCKDDEKGYVYTRVRRAECKIGNKVVDSSKCNPATKPVNVYMPCSDDRQWLKYKWTVGPWSSCSGCQRTRAVACVVGPHEFPVSHNLCNTAARPNQSEPCPTPSCGRFSTPSPRTTYSWHAKSWSLCRSCDKRYRSVECVDDLNGDVVHDDMCYSLRRPDESESCRDDSSCSYEGYHWSTGPWSPCKMCRKTREVECFDTQSGKVVCLEMCDPKQRPDEIGDCEDCEDWISEAWSECSASCGVGFQTRQVFCSSPENVRCYINKPQETKACDLPPCDGENAERSSLSSSVIAMAAFAVVVLPFGWWGIFTYLRRKIKKMQTSRRSRLRDDNIAEAESANPGHIPTISSGSVTTLPAFRDSYGICLQIQIKDLPNCFQKSNDNPEETLVDEFMKLTQPQGCITLRRPSSETKRNQESTELHQDGMITQSENRSPYYIKSKEKVVSIVTEGPTPSTHETFWKLMWQEKSPIIVNLTERKDITMPNNLLPTSDEIRRYGELVSLGTTKRAEYSIENVQVVKGSEIRHVIICHFFLWPETGIPEHPESLIGFIKKLRSLYQGHSAPIIVHCNNDLRSSSAFVTIFCLVEYLTSRQRVSVQDFVENLRDIDKDLTPNQDQYNFIYETLAAASLFPQVDLQPHTLLSMDLNNNSRLQKLIREYKALLNQQLFGTPAISAEGSKPSNAARNRYPNIVPLDRYRPAWSFSDNENASNYINGTLVDNVPQYWLEGFAAKYGKIIVECSSLNHWKSGVFLKRKMYVRREGDSTRLNIDHYQLLKWSTSSNNLSGLIDIIARIQPMLKAKKRIALHCMDGASRSGIIAAVSTELGRVKEDGVVDLFQTAVKLRRRNPMFIKCQEEYDFSYTLLQAALKAWRAEF